MLNAGPLNQRITLQQRTLAAGSASSTYAFANLATDPEVWAEANPTRGREYFAAAQQQVEGAMAFRIRFRDDLDATMRVLWRGEPYDIVAQPFDTRGAREDLWLYGVTGVRDGR